MKPILFNTDMVRAILDGRKTVTRRVVKPHIDSEYKYKLGYVVDSTDKKNEGCYAFGINEFGGRIKYAKPPYKVNDVLYVRETWKYSHGCYWHKAGFTPQSIEYVKWKPSIHMPKEAARLFLRVTDVRVEKLRDMKLEDFLKEGISINAEKLKTIHSVVSTPDEIEKAERLAYMEAANKFKDLWNSTAGKPFSPERYGNNWYGNPYVWVIEFEVIPADQAQGN